MLLGKKDLFVLQMQVKGNFWSLVRTRSALVRLLLSFYMDIAEVCFMSLA